MPRPLTDEDRARAQAYLDAMQKAMASIPEYDPDKVKAALEEVAKAHPIDDELREAYSAELEAKMADPLTVLDERSFLKPDAAWGLVVYRVSYSDDAAWDRMVSSLRQDIDSSLAKYQQLQPQLSSRHQLVLMDDKAKFQGASLETIRRHFTDWCVNELRRNWRSGLAPATDSTDYLERAGPRYNFCFLVDDICLESLEKMDNPVVKLVSRDWTPDSQDDEPEEEERLDWEGGETNSEYEDVGWMYVNAYEYVDVQNQLRDGGDWADMYVRPPLMRFEDDFDQAPGFWRRNASK
ncbi:hypothetical protein B0I35DRAFT_479884 [Stachybotrys elegans]|uniref:Uncharacterized protein n=1 Tax=Stachybotrys elegans TaxID=80388 RepID=A0A8K0SUB0_9HYPO|nr:hypothetical protein B0I35DRAFT_479884 [Stachybotrys elegans]